jgi:hypothetical protein
MDPNEPSLWPHRTANYLANNKDARILLYDFLEHVPMLSNRNNLYKILKETSVFIFIWELSRL